jgi:hypothetical protein
MLRYFGLITVSAVSAFAGSIYSVAALQPSGMIEPFAFSLNNAGQVAVTESAAYNVFRSTPWASTPVTSDAEARGINEAGHIAVNLGNQGFIWTPSGLTQVVLPAGGTTGGVEAINNFDQVSGGYNGNSGSGIFIGSTTASTAIALPNGWFFPSIEGLNDLGQAAGSATGPTGTQAFIATTSGITFIPLLPGWDVISGNAINNAGQIDGIGWNGSTTQAFVATTSGMTPIPLAAGASSAYFNYSIIDSLNEAGQVVGDSDVGGWVWDPSHGTVLLNSVVPTGWVINGAAAINDHGVILAQATYNGGADQLVLLTPTPEPSTFIMGLLAAAGLALRAKRRAHV